MKNIAFLAALAAAVAVCPVRAASWRWKCTTPTETWVDKPEVPVLDRAPVPTVPASAVLVSSKHLAQVIDGWGGCFNERGWKAMEGLAPADREALMRALFDPQTGLKFNLCRTPIGASDYAIDLYSLDETPGDRAMEHFSIDRDKHRLLPYIKAALTVRPDLKLWAVPWSPPSWMKNNGSLVGGYIKDDPPTLDALALYFARYLQAYRAEGVTVGMVMPQNEPSVNSNYTSCRWTGEQLAKFIGHHLGPTLAREHVPADIYLGTIADWKLGSYDYWVGPSMQDAQTHRFLAGVGCQWAGDVTMAETHFLHPDVKLMQTEAECGKPNTNDWAFGEKQFGLARKWFAAGASANIIWNLVLDETGLSTGNWPQCSPVVVDAHTGKITYTPYFYCYKHFSSFVQPGAHVAATESNWGDRVAFVNPDGEVVVVIGNTAATDQPVRLNIDGAETDAVLLPAHSFNTFTLAPRGP